jgi:hypothetical protein
MNMGSNSLNIQVANNSHKESNTSSFIMGFQWTRSFMDGALKPMVTYHADQRTEQDVKGTALKEIKSNGITNTAIGLQYNAGSLKAQFDYLTAVDDLDNVTDAGDEDTKTTSMVLRLAYNMGKWTPIRKYTTDASEAAGDDVDASTAYSLAAEYKPWAESSFKYFVSTSSKTTTYEAANTDDVTAGDMVAGFVAKF